MALKNFRKIVDKTDPLIKEEVVQWMDSLGNIHEPLTYICDNYRHLVCQPYSIENLHRMARNLRLKKKWFHKGNNPHYDIPINRIEEIKDKCLIVRPRQIVELIKTGDIQAGTRLD